MFYKHIFTNDRASYSKATQLSITFMSGYTAGVLCAIVSHPADTMVSKLNAVKSEVKKLGNLSKKNRDLLVRTLKKYTLKLDSTVYGEVLLQELL